MVVLTVARWNKEFTDKETKMIVAFHGVREALKELEELRENNDLDKYNRWEIDTIDDTSELTEELVLKQGKMRVKVFTGSFLDGIYQCDKIAAVNGRFFLYRNERYITSFPDTQTFEMEECL